MHGPVSAVPRGEYEGHFTYCSDPLSQKFHRLFIRMVFEVLTEGKHSFNVCLINKRKTGAVSKTQPSVLKIAYR